MSSWAGLLDGEYAERRKVLSGLTFEQVSQRLSPQSHSIYDELWHTELWQRILVTRDEALYESTWQRGLRYPDRPPETFEAWTALVESFFTGLGQAYDWTATAEKRDHEVDPGVTMAEVIRGLAVHNAYHFGKIVAIRQALGLWGSP